MRRLELTLLGGIQARLGRTPVTFPRRKAAGLLAYLAIPAGQVHPRDKLAALLWGEVPEPRARHSLRQALVTLRHVFGGRGLIEDGDGVALDGAALEVDVAHFERWAAEGRAGSAAALERAAALYRGDLLEGITIDEAPFEDWLRTERERLREQAVEVLGRLLAHQEAQGATDRAVQTAIRLLGLDPTLEEVHRVLMRLHARAGRRGAALRQYQACVDGLERLLGVEPEEATRRLYHDLLKAQPSVRRPEIRPPGSPGRRGPSWVDEPPATGAPLVGREMEIASIRSLRDAAWQGQGRIVLIGGEVGIGKTRLVEAACADAISTGGQLLIGRAHENEQVLPLGPWIDAFRAGDAVTTFEQLDTPWRLELGRLFPELGAPAPARLVAEDYARLFEAFARAVDHLALAHPLLLVLEDLHWADGMTLRMLAFLARRMTEWPLLVVVTYRVEEMAASASLRRCVAQVGRMPGALTLTLSPLSQADTGTLARRLARAGTDETALARFGERIWQASEGNPFMIVEMVRALDPQGGTLGGDAFGTPPSVRDLIAGRLDRLGSRARRLAGLASVIGRAFEFTLLQQTAGTSEAEAAEGVEELVARRILRAVGERLDFTHERIREVAYERLLPPYRKGLHRTVAQTLERMHAVDGDPHALAIGRHFLAGEAWERALHHLRHAAAWAATRAAHREAVASYELALEALRNLPADRDGIAQAIDLRFDLRHSCVPLGDHSRILAHLREAESAALSIADRRRLGWTLAYRTHALYLANDCATARGTGEEALAMAVELADPTLEEWTNLYLAQVYHWVGRYRDAVARLRENVQRLEPELGALGLPPKQYVNTRMILAWSLAELGEFEAARARTTDAIAAARETDSAYWLVHAYCGAAVVGLRQGIVTDAIDAAARALDLCRGRDYAALWGIPATLLGASCAAAGRSAEAVTLLEEVAATGYLPAPVLMFLGQAYHGAGRAADAERAASEALAIATRRVERGWEAWSHWVLGQVHASRSSFDAARLAYQEARTIAEALGMQPLVAHCCQGLADVCGRAGDTAAADEHRGRAAAVYARLDMRDAQAG
jgi:DNA-binding SARP family transcriptional activator/tetratricopeptide (TPR) repeat protein